MKNDQFRLVLWTVLTGVVCIVVWFGAKQFYQSDVHALREENLKLHEDLATNEAKIAELKERTDRLDMANSDSGGRTSVSLGADVDLNKRFAALAASQSNLVKMVEKFMQETGKAEAPTLTRRQREEASRMLRSRLEEQKHKVEESQKKIEELMISLNIPDEVAALESDKALDLPGLKTYWPYFEARRQRDNLRAFERILSMKVASELIDLDLPRSP